MSTRTYRLLTTRVEESGAGGADPVGWLPNDIPYPTGEVADQFSNVPGIPNMGYKSGGPGQQEISFRPQDDGAIPSNAKIDNVTYRLKLMWAKQDSANSDPFVDVDAFMVHQTTLGLDPEVEEFVPIGETMEVPELPTEFNVDTEDASVVPTWVVRWSGAGEKSPFLTRFGISHVGASGVGPVVIYNADVTLEFTLPAPEFVIPGSSWTINIRENDHISFTYLSELYDISLLQALEGTHTDGDALGALIIGELDKILNRLAWICTYNESTRQFTIGFVPGPDDDDTLDFNFDRTASIGETLGFFPVTYSGAATYTSGANFPSVHPIEDITPNSARIHGQVLPNGATLQYPVTVYAQYWPADASSTPVDTNSATYVGTDPQNVSFFMTGLLPDTDYICRLVASNNDHIVYGAEEEFTTPIQDGVTRR